MLADAILSEAYRFARNRMAVFWTVLFVPILFLVFGTLVALFTKARMAEIASQMPQVDLDVGGPVNLGLSLVKSAADFANPIVLLFVLIGVATLYAGDYRWETWRLTSARNTRANLLLGKVGVVKVVILLALAVWLIGGLAGDVIKAAMLARPVTFSMDGGDAAQFLGFSVLMWLRVIQFTMIGLLAAVVTRSLLAALFVPLVVAIGQFFLMQALPILGLEPGDWLSQLMLPGLAADTLKALIEGGPTGASIPDGVGIKAVVSLVVWTVGPLAASIALFQRQDLSKE